jgi:RNA 2',3'-cyclic 3'-phosphodiesterase
VRLFVAIVPPPAVAEEVARAVAGLPSAIRAELKRIAPERYHLTLAFLGDVPDMAMGRLADCLRDVAAESTAMKVHVTGSGHFDERVLWLALAGDTELMRELARRVSTAVVSTGLPLEQKPYRPHLTVARPRDGGSVAAATEVLSSYDGPSWTADELVLMRSRLGPHPTYEPQIVWPLAARADP